MPTIERLVLSNFKKFDSLELEFDSELNLLIGDNEAGKSSVLLALELVMSGSRSRIESIGMETLLNADAVKAFQRGPCTVDRLPRLFVEVYLSADKKPGLNGTNNSKGLERDGLRMTLEPILDFSKDIAEALKEDPANFPFDYYGVQFYTFAGEAYSNVKRYVRHLAIDSSRIDTEYAAREYTRSVFAMHADVGDRSRLENAYRKSKGEFKSGHLKELNDKLVDYKFGVRTSAKANLESDLVITENEIPIENKGKGRQCFIKTEFALSKRGGESRLDVLLLEEPENHLSHATMHQLVERIAQSANKQLFIATHSSLICSRLDLRKAILLGHGGKQARLNGLPPDTAKFFMKAPDNNVLEFALSRKVILVEGDAEFILLDALYHRHAGSTLKRDGVHVISVGGTSFKRYLDLAKLLDVRTAVIRDNDGDYQKNCVDNYAEHVLPHAMIFADRDSVRRRTFEICLYEDNKAICDAVFRSPKRRLEPLAYMLANKADAAFDLLQAKGAELVAPAYIQEAIKWINE
ncbi:AAA family ATPase [Burkholderia multivorans]|uniref:ATP-dependent nuclease n=1 Tax=Burkholderia multivorans TaxID=87883 RepID=UPI0007578A4D|nr:AAA family ATPase [Burkholderia multivorans]KVQ74833.1 ATP-dependent endonuclease [Burkholderia multivorans]MBU9560580.1 AAA family ATPase [Burkholderia multivorans]MEB2489037.1 AAA family ATPase [Burkholderia multivorans]MEB2568226.1 AAA family ATPase [Burkholderia multivorans]